MSKRPNCEPEVRVCSYTTRQMPNRVGITTTNTHQLFSPIRIEGEPRGTRQPPCALALTAGREPWRPKLRPRIGADDQRAHALNCCSPRTANAYLQPLGLAFHNSHTVTPRWSSIWVAILARACSTWPGDKNPPSPGGGKEGLAIKLSTFPMSSSVRLSIPRQVQSHFRLSDDLCRQVMSEVRFYPSSIFSKTILDRRPIRFRFWGRGPLQCRRNPERGYALRRRDFSRLTEPCDRLGAEHHGYCWPSNRIPT